VNVFLSLRNYEEFVYTLKQTHSSILRSTLVVVPQGKRTAILEGEIAFSQGYRILVWEQCQLIVGSWLLKITDMSYGVIQRSLPGTTHSRIQIFQPLPAPSRTINMYRPI
jgi:hypothetical protein